MPFEGAQGLAGGEIPQPQRVVIRAGEGAAAVGKKRHCCDPTLVSDQDLAERSTGRRQRRKSGTHPRPAGSVLRPRHQSFDRRPIGSTQSPEQLTGKMQAVADERRDRQPQSLLDQGEIGVLPDEIVISEKRSDVGGAQFCDQPIVIAQQLQELVDPIGGD